jgi:NADH-quinone oxidoreductase subunit A
MDLNPYLGLLLLGGASIGFLSVMLGLAIYLGPRNRSATKDLPFECGSVSVGEVSQQRFNVRFYLVAMVFILFDVEVIFMYPWAVTLMEFGWNGYFAMLSFMAVLTVGLIYVWRRGVLDWSND